MTDATFNTERRNFSRIQIDAKVELHQGGVTWQVDLINLSLNGLTVSQPKDWDANYRQLFTAHINPHEGSAIELYVHLIHIENETMGFRCDQIDEENLQPLLHFLKRNTDQKTLTQEQEKLISMQESE